MFIGGLAAAVPLRDAACVVGCICLSIAPLGGPFVCARLPQLHIYFSFGFLLCLRRVFENLTSRRYLGFTC